MDTQAEYLRFLAGDLRESGQTATAEDIENAAGTIELLRAARYQQSRDSQALRVRYVGATNTKPARVIVTEWVPEHMGRNPSHTMDWQDDLEPRENRLLAAQEYLDQYFKPSGPDPVRVNPDGLCFGDDYFYGWTQ